MNSHTVPRVLFHPVEQKFSFRIMQFLLQLAICDSLIMIGGSNNDDSSLSRQLLWGTLGLISTAYIIGSKFGQGGRAKNQLSFGGWPIALLLAYTLASTVWSVAPDVTFKRVIVLGFLVAVCGNSVHSPNDNWHRDTFSRLLANPMAWLIGSAILLTLVLPGRAFTDLGWRGVSSQKNEAGQMMAFAALLLTYGKCHRSLSAKLRVVFFIFSIALLLLSKSSTALLALLSGIVIVETITLSSTIQRLGSWKPVIFGALFIASVIFYFAYQLDLLPTLDTLYSKILGALGKSETFTGRTAIWNLVLGESRFHNTLIGGGYGSFWVGRNSLSSYVIIGNNLYPGQAHNGYIDIYNDLGVLGLFLLAVVVSVALYRAKRLLALGHPEAKLHLAIPIFCIFLNLGESTFFRGTHFMNIVFLASFISAFSVLRAVHITGFRSLDTHDDPGR